VVIVKAGTGFAVSVDATGCTDNRRLVNLGEGFDVGGITGVTGLAISKNVSTSGEGGEDEHLDGIVMLSVSAVRDVRVEIIDAREPSRILSSRESALDATDEFMAGLFAAAAKEWTSAGKLASLGVFPGVLCGDRWVPVGTGGSVKSAGTGDRGDRGCENDDSDLG
jgi:hypothetical protein